MTTTSSNRWSRPTASSGRISSRRLALDAPVALAKLEERRGVPSARELVERAGIEVDADQGEQVTGLPVARPEDLVVPLGRLPALAFGGIELGSAPR